MTTTLSSRGQIVLPSRVRRKLGLRPGTRFSVLTDGGKVVLAPQESGRKIVQPSRDRKTGLPTFPIPRGTPRIPENFVHEALADFP